MGSIHPPVVMGQPAGRLSHGMLGAGSERYACGLGHPKAGPSSSNPSAANITPSPIREVGRWGSCEPRALLISWSWPDGTPPALADEKTSGGRRQQQHGE